MRKLWTDKTRMSLWEILRWEMKCSQLKILAAKFGTSLDDISDNTMQKERMAKRIAARFGIKEE